MFHPIYIYVYNICLYFFKQFLNRFNLVLVYNNNSAICLNLDVKIHVPVHVIKLADYEHILQVDLVINQSDQPEFPFPGTGVGGAEKKTDFFRWPAKPSMINWFMLENSSNSMHHWGCLGLQPPLTLLHERENKTQSVTLTRSESFWTRYFLSFITSLPVQMMNRAIKPMCKATPMMWKNPIRSYCNL